MACGEMLRFRVLRGASALKKIAAERCADPIVLHICRRIVGNDRVSTHCVHARARSRTRQDNCKIFCFNRRRYFPRQNPILRRIIPLYPAITRFSYIKTFLPAGRCYFHTVITRGGEARTPISIIARLLSTNSVRV